MNTHIEKYYDSLDEMIYRFDRFSAADRFDGDDVGALTAWQNKTRELVRSLIGLDKLMNSAASEETDDKSDNESKLTLTEETEIGDGIVRSHYLLKLDRFTTIPMYVLVPAGEPEGTFLVLAGHQGGGKYSVAGVRDIRIVREKIDFFNYDYGVKLAKLGYIAVCPDPRGFGERRDKGAQGDSAKDFVSCSCRHLSHMAVPMGLTAVGLCVYDYIRLIDYMEQSGIWPMDDLGCIGFSGGGMQTLFLTAVEPRVKMAFISGYMYGYRDALMVLNNNCSCNYIPGLWEHLDMGDIASLIAPRPLFIQSCKSDHLNGPRGMDNVYEQVDIIKRAYDIYGKSECLVHDVRDGEHHFHDEPLKETIDAFRRSLDE